MGWRNVDWTLDDNETISAGLKDASEEEEPDHQHQFFVHGALVGNSRKMLPAFKTPMQSTIRGGRTIFDQKAGRDSQTSIRCSVREEL
jgi:hypothetical protein